MARVRVNQIVMMLRAPRARKVSVTPTVCDRNGSATKEIDHGEHSTVVVTKKWSNLSVNTTNPAVLFISIENTVTLSGSSISLGDIIG